MHIVKRKNPLKYQYIAKISDKKEREGLYLDEVGESGLFKVLGGCIICLNVWIGFATFIIIHIILGISFWYMPVYLLSGSFILRKITKID